MKTTNSQKSQGIQTINPSKEFALFQGVGFIKQIEIWTSWVFKTTVLYKKGEAYYDCVCWLKKRKIIQCQRT